MKHIKLKLRIAGFFLFSFVLATYSNCLAQGDDHSGHNTSPGDSTKTGAVSYYTCPMHPEIQSTFTATCPKCGMALVQKNSSSTDDKMNMMMMCPMHGMTDMNHNHDGEKKNKKKMMMGTGVMGVMMVVMMALMIAGGAVFLMGR